MFQTTYQDHFNRKSTQKQRGYEPGGRAKYDTNGSSDNVSPLKRREKGRTVSQEITTEEPIPVTEEEEIEDMSGRKTVRSKGKPLPKPSPKTDVKHRANKDSKDAVVKDSGKPETEVSVEDLGPPSVFYPVTPGWQMTNAKKLGVRIQRTLNFGTQKRFYATTPPRMTEPVRGDGNCFFRAICSLITGSESDHMDVRKAVTQHVSDHPNLYRTFLESRGGMTKYLNVMKQSREWATDTEIMATATLLKSVVMVYFPCQVGTRFEYRWQEFKPLDNPDITYPIIYLANKNEHFEPVLDIELEDMAQTSIKKESGQKQRGKGHEF
ncbi:hypothetical protein FSP39_025381 [Pinctada imbricata]|uniref:OTU domain-containing protein n=1 Tax=Pinctada imbricata TaxID=66713 RepID=A0AA88YAV5_PINIB|nr:hypothetical protein FSP39_025381 [Pinctada imbricata]